MQFQQRAYQSQFDSIHFQKSKSLYILLLVENSISDIHSLITKRERERIITSSHPFKLMECILGHPATIPHKPASVIYHNKSKEKDRKIEKKRENVVMNI